MVNGASRSHNCHMDGPSQHATVPKVRWHAGPLYCSVEGARVVEEGVARQARCTRQARAAGPPYPLPPPPCLAPARRASPPQPRLLSSSPLLPLTSAPPLLSASSPQRCWRKGLAGALPEASCRVCSASQRPCACSGGRSAGAGQRWQVSGGRSAVAGERGQVSGGR